MNNYEVTIRMGGKAFSSDAVVRTVNISARELSKVRLITDNPASREARFLVYKTEKESAAMAVYSKAKRNLDQSKYQVELNIY